MKKKIIALTAGDPAGIGPEIAVKLIKRNHKSASIIVFGDLMVMLGAQRKFAPGYAVVPVKDTRKIPRKKKIIPLYDLKNKNMSSVEAGKVSADAGRAAFSYIKAAINAALKGDADAVLTAPISKEAFHRAGINYAGHTEIFAEMTKTKNYAMMLASGGLRVVLVTIHTALTKVPGLLSTEKIYRVTALADKALKKDFGIKAPRIGIAALNPHAGENCAFGKEEENIIAPAVLKAKKAGILASGPFPSDTVFYRAVVKKEFDAVICLSLIHI